MTTAEYVVIPAGWTPEDWAWEGPLIMARLRAELTERGLLEDPPELPNDLTVGGLTWRSRSNGAPGFMVGLAEAPRMSVADYFATVEDPPELDDDDVVPDETRPQADDVKTDPIPEDRP